MNLTVPEDSNLLICKGALHSVWVITKVIFCGLDIFRCERGQLFTREMLGMKDLEVFLDTV